MYWDIIPSDTYQFCNLCQIIVPFADETENRNDFTIERRNNYKVHLDLYWKSIDNSFIINPGIYDIELIISCSNGKPIIKNFKLNFTGKWSEDENTMFNEGILILQKD